MDFIKDNQKEMKTKLPILLLACLCGCEKPQAIYIVQEQKGPSGFELEKANQSTNSYALARKAQEGHVQFNHDPELKLNPPLKLTPVSFQTSNGEWLNVSWSDEYSARPDTAILKCKYRPIVTETGNGWRITFDTSK